MSEQLDVQKFEWTNEQKTVDGILYTRIQAVKDFADVKVGDLGGWMDKATFLSDAGDCWIYDNAMVSSSFLYDDATITDEAFVRRTTLKGEACVIPYLRSCLQKTVSIWLQLFHKQTSSKNLSCIKENRLPLTIK